MSSDVIARLETLLNRVVSRRALPRTAAPVEVPVLATSPAPKAIAPEPLKPEAPRLEALRPEAPKPTVAEAPKPTVVEVPEAPKPPVVEAPKPAVAEATKSTLLEVLPSVAASMDSTQVSRRVPEAPTAAPKTSLPAVSPFAAGRRPDRGLLRRWIRRLPGLRRRRGRPRRDRRLPRGTSAPQGEPGPGAAAAHHHRDPQRRPRGVHRATLRALRPLDARRPHRRALHRRRPEARVDLLPLAPPTLRRAPPSGVTLALTLPPDARPR